MAACAWASALSACTGLARGHEHGDMPYRVVGVLAEGGGVVDRLVLTSLDSVWAVHEVATGLDDDERRALEAEREVTLVLVSDRSHRRAVRPRRRSVPRLVVTTCAPSPDLS